MARLLRAGERTPVWVPDAGHEAMRDLVRARAAAIETLRAHRQQVSAFMLKHGRHYPGKKTWGARYLRWLQGQSFEHPAHQIVLQETIEAVRLSQERVVRLARTIAEFVGSWTLAPVVVALQALRGVDLIVAVTFVAEIGDLRRFDNPRQLMAYLGLVPGERSTGDTVRRGGITKAGNGRVRYLLVESAWDLSASATHRGEEALAARARITKGAGDWLEGPEPSERPLPRTEQARQEDDGDMHCDRPRTRRSPAPQLIGTPRKRTISVREVDHGQGHEHRKAAGRRGATAGVRRSGARARREDLASAEDGGGAATATERGP